MTKKSSTQAGARFAIIQDLLIKSAFCYFVKSQNLTTDN